MDINHLYNWLATLELSRHYQLFIDSDITFDLLPAVDRSTLKEIGIDKVGDTIKLIAAIKKLKLNDLANSIQLNELLHLIDNNNDQQTHQVIEPKSTNNNNINNSNSNITVILQDGTTKKVNVEGCFNSDSIKRKILKKLNVKPVTNWDTYIIDDRDQLHLMFDVELITVCHSNDDTSLAKNRIIFCKAGETPTQRAIDTSHRITTRFNLLNKQKLQQQQHLPNSNPASTQLRNFFGQRPPSELISTNLAEYFPNTKADELQETVRNSVRMSKLINNPRFSMLSRQSTRQSIVSSRLSPKTSNNNKTIGDVIINNRNSIYEQQQQQQQQPTLVSSRVSIVSSIDNRTSKIELFDEDDDDYGDEGFDLDAFDDSILSQLSLEEETGPTHWLKGAKIGSGSFGVVYLGMNSLTGELMAVKQVELPSQDHKKNKDHKTHAQLMIDALKQEMSLLKNLHHENIVTYIGSNSDANHLNIFLEYVPGGSVTTMLNNYGPFEEPLIRNFVRQILIGLNYLHGEHIIHRDIKGANVLIDIKGTVKISDFGISKKLSPTSTDPDDSTTSTSTTPAAAAVAPVANRRASLQGSVYWMAPEVVKQTAYTAKADIWSVGCLIVEMFTGKHPFPDFSQMQAIFKIGTHTRPQVPMWATADAKAFLGRTFELDYTRRPSAAALLEDAFINNLILSKR